MGWLYEQRHTNDVLKIEYEKAMQQNLILRKQLEEAKCKKHTEKEERYTTTSFCRPPSEKTTASYDVSPLMKVAYELESPFHYNGKYRSCY